MNKQYSVFELYVVKVKKYYFICEKLDNNIYREVFTKEKFQVLNSENVESLCDYYSILVIKNYSTGEPLMLSKIQLLVKYAEINASPVVKAREENALANFLEYQQEYLETLKYVGENNPEAAKEIAIDSLCKAGILDEDGELAEPYKRFSKTLKKD